MLRTPLVQKSAGQERGGRRVVMDRSKKALLYGCNAPRVTSNQIEKNSAHNRRKEILRHELAHIFYQGASRLRRRASRSLSLCLQIAC